MGIKRIYVRVPLSGQAILSNNNNPTIKARTIDISQGGVAVATFSEQIPTAEYHIEILTEEKQKIEIFAKLVRVDDSIAGFQTLQMDQKSQEIIKNLVFEYETTTDFINQLDEFNLLNDKVVDEEGNEIEITFDKDFNGNQ
jgi:c-di-GMP-binding flagellar brake protein YcgR